MTGGKDPCTPGAGLQKRFPEMSATCRRGHPLQGAGVHGLDRGCPESLSEEAVLSRPRPEVGVFRGGKRGTAPFHPHPGLRAPLGPSPPGAYPEVISAGPGQPDLLRRQAAWGSEWGCPWLWLVVAGGREL